VPQAEAGEEDAGEVEQLVSLRRQVSGKRPTVDEVVAVEE
jgi:hypothetical protein